MPAARGVGTLTRYNKNILVKETSALLDVRLTETVGLRFFVLSSLTGNFTKNNDLVVGHIC